MVFEGNKQEKTLIVAEESEYDQEKVDCRGVVYIFSLRMTSSISKS